MVSCASWLGSTSRRGGAPASEVEWRPVARSPKFGASATYATLPVRDTLRVSYHEEADAATERMAVRALEMPVEEIKRTRRRAAPRSLFAARRKVFVVAEPANARIGTSADELFTIRAVSPGATRVRFAQRRPWELDDKPAVKAQVVEVRVT